MNEVPAKSQPFLAYSIGAKNKLTTHHEREPDKRSSLFTCRFSAQLKSLDTVGNCLDEESTIHNSMHAHERVKVE